MPTCVCIACAQIPTWSAVLHGGIGGLVYTFASSRVLKAKIDDPLDAFAVHGACGMWGVLAASLFSSNKYSKGGRAGANPRLSHTRLSHTCLTPSPHPPGLFYGDGEMFGAALVFLICVIAWSASLSLAVRLGNRALSAISHWTHASRRIAHSTSLDTTHMRKLISSIARKATRIDGRMLISTRSSANSFMADRAHLLNGRAA